MLQPFKKKHTKLNRPHREEAFDILTIWSAITARLRNRAEKSGIRNRYIHTARNGYTIQLRRSEIIVDRAAPGFAHWRNYEYQLNFRLGVIMQLQSCM